MTRGAEDGYVLCTTPRSGSTMLCGMLRDTGMAGVPDSHFHQPSLASWRQANGLVADAPLCDILAAALKAGRGDTPVFGLRLQQHSTGFFFETLRSAFPDLTDDRVRLEASFGKLRFIHLRRQDKLAQAISFLRAQQSGLWHRHADGRALERLAPEGTAGYDTQSITAQIANFERQDLAWQNWFNAQGIAPLTLEYETLSARPLACLREVLGFLDLPVTATATVKVGTSKLADAQSAEWAARYRSERPEE